MKILNDLAQGVYDGLQENEKTRNQFSYKEIIDVMEECVAYIFLGLICTVFLVFIHFYFKISIEGFLILLCAFVLYGFVNSKEYKKIKKK